MNRIGSTLLLISALLLPSMAAQAENDFPNRPITLVVAFPAGGGVDTVGRLIGKAMSEKLGQPIIIENRPGAAGQLGTTHVARRAKADGYTLLLTSPGAATGGPAIFPDLDYDTKRDLAAIGLVVTMPNLLVANPKFPARTAADLIELAKSGQVITYGSGGVGTGQHLAGELLAHTLGIKMLHVPYKGTAPAVIDTISGQIDLSFPDTSAIQHVRSGQLNIIGVTTAERSRALPDLPTIAEGGASGYSAASWYGLVAPKKTPASTINRLNEALNHALQQPEIQETLLANGMDPTPTTPEEFQQFLEEDLERWTSLVQAIGLKAE